MAKATEGTVNLDDGTMIVSGCAVGAGATIVITGTDPDDE